MVWIAQARVVTSGLVQQQGHISQRQKAGVRVKLNGLVQNAELRLFNDYAIYLDPTSLNVLLGFAA